MAVKTDIRNSLIYMTPIVVNTIIPLITIPIFTRILTQNDYGLLALATIYATLFNGLANLGLPAIFERSYFEFQNDLKKLSQLFFSSMVFVILNFIFLLSLTYVFKNKISLILTGSPDNSIFICITMIAHFFYATINNFYFNYYKNSKESGTFTKFRILNSIIYFITSIYFVVFLRIGLLGIVLAQLFAGLLVFAVLFYQILKKLKFSFNKEILFNSLKIGYPLVPRLFIGVINSQFDKYMIGHFIGLGNVGVYHIGKMIAEQGYTFMYALQNVFNPEVYKRMFEGDKNQNSIGEYLTPFFYISIFVVLTISLFSKEIIILVAPKNYHGATPIISTLSIYFGFLFFNKLVGTQLLFKKKSHMNSLLTLISVILNVILNIPLIISYGAFGAAIATSMAGLISGLISLCVAQYYFKINY